MSPRQAAHSASAFRFNSWRHSMIQSSEAPKRRNIRHTGQGEAEAHASPTGDARSGRHGPAGIEQGRHEEIGADRTGEVSGR